MKTIQHNRVSATFNTSTYREIFTHTFKWVVCISFLLIGISFAFAQDQLVGLASTSGPGGNGTAFSINLAGGNFKLERAFTTYGANPYGDLIKGTDGNLYGMTYSEGLKGVGTIFKITPGGNLAILRNLNYSLEGGYPHGSLVLGPDNSFYGMTSHSSGGESTIFKLTSSGTFSVINRFNISNSGKTPLGTLIVKNGYLYGMTHYGGIFGNGTVFRVLPSGQNMLVLHNFNKDVDGAFPNGNLVEGVDGNLYGMTTGYQGKYGSIFRITPGGQHTYIYNLEINSAARGYEPYGSLIKGRDNNLYGMMRQGGASGGGTIFRLNSTGGGFTVLANLNLFTTGGNPEGSLCDGGDGYLYGMTSNGGNYSKGTIFKILLSTRAITVLRHLNNTTEGASPKGSLYKNSDGYLYGMTQYGGNTYYNDLNGNIGAGTIFRIKPDGSGFSVLSILYDGDGKSPQKSLLLATNGNYYGTTNIGGKYNAGTLFSLSSAGSFKTLYSFNPAVDGENPKSTLIQGFDGHLYGTTYSGGTNNSGTLFQWRFTGGFSALHHFSYATGTNPEGRLLQLEDGTFYGTTRNGGRGYGTVFKFSLSNNNYTVLKTLDLTSGAYPTGGLNFHGGSLWGMTRTKGLYGFGTMFRMGTDGTFGVAVNFDMSTGVSGYGEVVQASDGVLYGMTNSGGDFNGGTIFRYTISRKTFHVIHHFASGSKPLGSFTEGSDGSLYGMTSAGGTYNAGTIFKLSADRSFSTLFNFNPAIHGSTPLGSLIFKKTVAGTTTVRLNSGGGSVNTSLGPFAADAYLTGSTKIYSTTAEIANTIDDAIYQNYITAATAGGTFGYHIPVSNGTYKVNLHFAEVYFTASAKRSFNVSAEGLSWLSNYDIFTAAGGINKAIVVSKDIPVSDGFLDLSFVSLVNQAAISAVEVVPASTLALFTPTLTASLLETQTSEKLKLPVESLYPNPVTEKLTVSLNEPSYQGKVIVMNTSGQKVITSNVQTSSGAIELNVANLIPGLYYLKIETIKGTRNFKFVKQ